MAPAVRYIYDGNGSDNGRAEMKKGIVTFTLFVLVLALQMACATSPAADKAADERDFIYGDFTYIFIGEGENQTLSITGYRGTCMNLNIPCTIKGIRVTHIEAWAFFNDRLTSLIIPDSITYVGALAFWGNSLTELSIPDSVTYIGDNAFAYNKLTSVNISNRVANIGHSVFSLNQLTSVSIPDSVTNIGNGAFLYNFLTALIIGNNVSHIGDMAFAFNQLTSLIIPDSVSYIGAWAFSGNELSRVSIGNNVHISGNFDEFDNSFIQFYESQGRRAGTYTFRNGAWSMATGNVRLDFI
jgi:hypothetical protein